MRWAPYQQRWLADRSRMRAVVKSRRIGFSEVAAWRRAVRALGFGWMLPDPVPAAWPPNGLAPIVTVKPVPQNITSASERQALEFLSKVRVHLDALGQMAWGASPVVHANAHEIVLYNGTKLRAFAPNPRTIRGDGGDLTLDEFGAMGRAREVWKAAKPLADPTLSDPDGFEVDFIGTPEGDDNLFYEVIHDAKFEHVSRHKVDIFQAVADGFPLRDTIEALREEAGDEDTWLQEYCCSFLSSSMRYISAELYDACLYDDDQLPPMPHNVSRYGGYDVGRRNDAAAYVETAHTDSKLWHIETEIENDLEFEAQQQWIGRKCETLLRLCVDAGGMGEGQAEWLVKRHQSRVEPLWFTSDTKAEVVTGLKLAMERKILKLRREDTKLRTQTLLLRREQTKAGNIRYDIKRSKGSHGDAAIALALSVHASGLATKRTDPVGPHALIPHGQGRDLRQPARPVERARRGAWR